MITSYHDSVKDVQAQFGSAGGLAGTAIAPFDRTDWYDLLQQAGLSPLYACVEDGEEGAFLALSQTGRHLEALRNWYAFTWRPQASRNAHGDQLISHIARDLRSRAHRVTLEPVPNECGSADQIARAFAKAGWRVEVSQCDTNHFIRLRGRSFADFWSTRPGPLRTTLKRKGNKVETHMLTEFDASMWAHYERIYSASWKPDEDHPGMLRAFAENEARSQRLRLGIALYENEPIAAQFWTVENGCAYIHKLAHLDEHRNLSAGTTLSAAMFKHVIDIDKVELVDFGTGDQPYKSDWMGETRPRYRIDCLNMKSPRAWVDLARLAYRRLQSDTVPALAPRPAAG